MLADIKKVLYDMFVDIMMIIVCLMDFVVKLFFLLFLLYFVLASKFELE